MTKTPIVTYPEMNEQIVELLRLRRGPVSLYAAARIEELEQSNVIEWDMDDNGLACAVTKEDERWFCILIPPSVIEDKFLTMQEDLRQIARKYRRIT